MMAALVTPVHVGTINGQPLRFFSPPGGQAGLCWVSWDDLPVCAGLSRGLRRHLLQKLKADYAADARTIATPDGVVTIGPSWMASGFLSSMTDTGLTSAAAEVAYSREARAAWNALHRDVPPVARAQMLVDAIAHEVRS